MSTTHILIVDDNTFKYHLEYLFIGTGSKDYDYNLDNAKNERLLVSMLADLNRLKIGDYIVFYLQQSQKDNREGKFYGIFKVSSNPFIDEKGEYLLDNLEKN